MTFIMSFQSVPHPHLVVSRKAEKEQKASKTSQRFRASNDPFQLDRYDDDTQEKAQRRYRSSTVQRKRLLGTETLFCCMPQDRP
jgi:hypothetical protein